jgi:chemotaxis protein MotB
MDKLQSQVRTQQHAMAGQTRQIEALTAERDALKKQLEEQALLLKTHQDKASQAESALSQAGQESADLRRRLEELADKEPEFEYDKDTGTLSVAAEVLFDSGKVRLKQSGMDALRKVAPILAESDHLIRIDGHTDSDPIKHSKWEDNWQLAAERARQVLKFLLQEGVARERLFFAAFADTRPKAENSSTDGKRINRRVELLPLDEKRAAIPAAQVSSATD